MPLSKALGAHDWLQHAVFQILCLELRLCRAIRKTSVEIVLHAADCKSPTRNGPGMVHNCQTSIYFSSPLCSALTHIACLTGSSELDYLTSQLPFLLLFQGFFANPV